MKKLAFLFPGQGSQSVGMGKDFYDKHQIVREIFDAGSKLSGTDLAALCFNGPEEELTRTVNLQPAVTAVNLGIFSVLSRNGIRPEFVAGHSLGEYSALCAAGAISVESALRLTARRAALMEREAGRNPGTMAAVIGLPPSQVEALVARARSHGEVAIANYNCDKQVVVTGSPEPVQALGQAVADAGGRALSIRVSGAWHSPLMKGAQEEMVRALEAEPFDSPECAMVFNVTAEFEADPQRIRHLMADQICHPVRWHESVLRISAQAPDAFVEVGPGKVLAGLLKRIVPAQERVPVFCVNTLPDLDKVLGALG